MADKKISDLTAATALTTGDLLEIETAAGASRKIDSKLIGTSFGTSFPGSPTSGDRFYRTDRAIEYYYDGTRWLSTQLFNSVFFTSTAAITVTTSFYFTVPYLQTYNIYLVSIDTSAYRTLAGEWDFVLTTRDSADTLGALVTVDGSGDASTTWVAKQTAINTVLTSATKVLVLAVTEISGTSQLNYSAGINYRLVG